MLGPQPEGVAVAVDDQPRLLDEGPQLGELGGVEGEPGAGVQHQVVVPGGERGEELGQRHLLVADGDLDVQVEPVARLRLADGEPDDGVALGRREDGGLAVQVDEDVVALLQHRQDLGDERDEGAAGQEGGAQLGAGEARLDPRPAGHGLGEPGLGDAVAGNARLRGEADVADRRPGAVAETPPDAGGALAEVDPAQQARRLRLGQDDAVAHLDGDRAPQLRQVAGRERLDLPVGDAQLAVPEEARGRGGERAAERTEQDLVVAGDPGAVRGAAEEGLRGERDHLAVQLGQRPHGQRVAVAGDAHQRLDPLDEPGRGQRPACVGGAGQERDPGGDRLGERGPARGQHRAQRERVPAGVAVDPLGGPQGAQRHAVPLAEPGVRVGDVVPADPRADPVLALARPQQADGERARLLGDLQGQRGAVVGAGEERGEHGLPPLRLGGGPGRHQGEEEGDAVLAAPLHRAAAVGEQPGGRAGADGAVVAAVVAAAHRRGGQLADCLDRRHAPQRRVLPPAGHRGRAEDPVEFGIGQALEPGGQFRHRARDSTTSRPKPSEALIDRAPAVAHWPRRAP